MVELQHSSEARLRAPPCGFFMSLRDIAFWLRSWAADRRLAALRRAGAPQDAFDLLYRRSFDPFAAEAPQYRYQARKYESLLSMLPARRYGAIMDIGCGLGGLTRRLAPHGDRVVGIDVSQEALRQASLLSADLGHVHYLRGDLAALDLPPGPFDLIALADTLYYLETLSDSKLKDIAGCLAARLNPDGVMLLANHFFFGLDHASRETRRIHDAFRRHGRLVAAADYRRPFFMVTVLRPRPVASLGAAAPPASLAR
jgi:SAM-dependent methyltransferase